MSTPPRTLVTVRLPRKHVEDWLNRTDIDDVHLVMQTAQTVTVRLTSDALADLRADAQHYATCMGPDNTGDIDYRPAARRCLAALDTLTRTHPDHRCPGCGRRFTTARGLTAHGSAPHQAMACLSPARRERAETAHRIRARQTVPTAA